MPADHNAKSTAGLELGPLDHSIAFHLSIANTLLLQTFLAMIGDKPRNARYVILLLIKLNPGATQADLSETNFRDKSSMSPVLNEFMREGLVRRAPTIRNGRAAQALSLTEAGEAEFERLRYFADAHSKMTRDLLGDADTAQLIDLLKRLSKGLVGGGRKHS